MYIQMLARQFRVSVVVALTIACMGCVFNPYVRTMAVHRGNADADGSNLVLLRGKCKTTSGTITRSWPKTSTGLGALDYAACLRDEMAKKAGSYAVMNSGGGTVLLGLAGLAGYRGIQGGHKAQVAALTTGGAALYGAQQYVYSKPREALYWQGASALDCAIGVTMQKMSVTQAEIGKLSGQINAITVPDVSGGQADLVSFKSNQNASGCTSEANQEYAELLKLMEFLVGPDNEALKKRLGSIKHRADRIRLARTQADLQLISASDGIREAVNRQLATEQPDPAELKKLIADLSLPGLTGSTGDAKAEAKGMPSQASRVAAGTTFNKRAARFLSLDGETLLTCSLTDILPKLRQVVKTRLQQRNQVVADLDGTERALDTLERAMGISSSGDEPIKACSLGRTDPLLPFALGFVSEGAQIIKPGDTLKVPITGGVAPFAVRLMSDKDHGLVASVQRGVGGDAIVVIPVPKDATDGVVSWLVRDAVGASEVLRVEVKK